MGQCDCDRECEGDETSFGECEVCKLKVSLNKVTAKRDALRLALIEMEFNELEDHYYYSCSECLANRVLRDAALNGGG